MGIVVRYTDSVHSTQGCIFSYVVLAKFRTLSMIDESDCNAFGNELKIQFYIISETKLCHETKITFGFNTALKNILFFYIYIPVLFLIFYRY